MENIYLEWTSFKTRVNQKAKVRYVEKEEFYKIYYSDDGGIFETSIIKDDSADQTDFETNYKPLSNLSLEGQRDSDGSVLQRLKVTASGWTLHYHGLEITTSSLAGVVDLDHNNNDWGFCSTKLYDSGGTLITTEEGLVNCVKTVIDWEPTFNFDIIGGYIYQFETPSSDVRASVMGVPDIPAIYGGSKVFMTGLNLKHLTTNGMTLDGRTPKSLVYSAVNHTSKIRFIFWHDAGFSHTALIMLNIFKA